MKRIKNLSKLMLAVMTMLVMVSCGSSSDDANNGAAYTPEEISEILTGNWTYYGDFVYKNNDGVIAGNFNGGANFKKDKRLERSIKITITENSTKLSEEEAMKIPSSAFPSSYTYKINKEAGKNYIKFHYVSFEITSLTKNTFVFRTDDDYKIDYDGNVNGHLYMTVNSK